jgi:hypothetical protein
MRKTALAALTLIVISLCSFDKESVNYEQIIFDYFISDILPADFDDVNVLEFKGTTESSFTTLGNYKVCLKPAEKLTELISPVTTDAAREIRQIKYEPNRKIKVSDINKASADPKIYLYPAVRVADNYYVFLLMANRYETFGKYVFELTPNGEILRSCKM